MARYKLIDGHLVDVRDIPQEEKKTPHFNAGINLTPGLNWGKKGYQQRWITANKEGTGRDLVEEIKK
tara:strand:+ start:175 stop:375 length:201 start_codon:yes stop_codon:yes gene_type:complete